MPGYLEAMGAALEGDPGAAFAYTDAWYLDERTRRIRRASAMAYQRPPEPPPATAAELFALLCERNFIYNAVTVRRAAVDGVGPPDARLRSMIDWEWWLRLAAAGHRAVRVPGRLGVYRLRRRVLSRDPRAGRRRPARPLADRRRRVRPARRTRASGCASGCRRFDAEVAALSGRRPAALALWRLRRRAVARGRRCAARATTTPSRPPRSARRSVTCGASSSRSGASAPHHEAERHEADAGEHDEPELEAGERQRAAVVVRALLDLTVAGGGCCRPSRRCW